MNNFMRDVLATMTYEAPVEPSVDAGQNTLSRLDRRLADLIPGAAGSKSVLKVRAGDCKVWDGNPRDVQRLSSENCRSLIESIAAEAGNRIPVLVRVAPPGAPVPYELLVGSRRRFSVDWLNHNGRPEILLNALVVELSDEEAFRLADIENREREDISELDRARSYQSAVDRFYAGIQSRMAQALGLSNSQLSRLLSLAQLPDAVVDAFPTREDLRVRHSEVLTPLLRRPEQRALVVRAAEEIGAEQRRYAAAGERLIQPAAVLARLRRAVVSEAADQSDQSVLISAGGERIGRIRLLKGGAIALELTLAAGSDVDALLRCARTAIFNARSADACEDGDDAGDLLTALDVRTDRA